MKPERIQAMQKLIAEIRETLPFEDLNSNICTGQCNHCSIKLLEFLDSQIEEWEYLLRNGEIPSFGEINQLAKMSKKIYRALAKHNLVD